MTASENSLYEFMIHHMNEITKNNTTEQEIKAIRRLLNAWEEKEDSSLEYMIDDSCLTTVWSKRFVGSKSGSTQAEVFKILVESK